MEPGTTKKVLIADGDAASLHASCLIVQSLGYECRGVGRADDVLPSVRRERPDVLLQDLRMPGTNVARLVAEMRLDPRTARIPVVLFGQASDANTLASTAEPWGSLSKPLQRFEVGALLARLADVPHEAPAGGDAGRRIDAMLQEHWSVLASLTGHASVLDHAMGLDWDGERAALLLGEGILALEAKTDRLGCLLREWASVVDGMARAGST